MVNLSYDHSLTDIHTNLVVKFEYFKDMGDVDPFIISGVDGGKEQEQGKRGL